MWGYYLGTILGRHLEENSTLCLAKSRVANLWLQFRGLMHLIFSFPPLVAVPQLAQEGVQPGAQGELPTDTHVQLQKGKEEKTALFPEHNFALFVLHFCVI